MRDTDQDDEFAMLADPEDDKPEVEIRLGLVTGYPLSSAELEAEYADARHDDESPTYFTDSATGEITAVMFDKELNTTIEIVIQEGVSHADE